MNMAPRGPRILTRASLAILALCALIVAAGGHRLLRAAIAPAALPTAPESARAAQLPLTNRLRPDRVGFLGIRTDLNPAGKLIAAAIESAT